MECTIRGREPGEKSQDPSCKTPTCSAPANSGVPNTGKDVDLLEQIQRRAGEMIRGMGHLSCKENAKRLELFCLEKRRVQGDLVADFLYLWGIYNNHEDFLQGCVVTGHGGEALN